MNLNWIHPVVVIVGAFVIALAAGAVGISKGRAEAWHRACAFVGMVDAITANERTCVPKVKR